MKWMSIAVLGVSLLAAHAGAEETPVLKTPMDKVNYGIGVEVVRNFKYQAIDFDIDLVIKGMRDAASGGALLLPEKELRKLMQDYQAELRRKQIHARRTASDDNKKRGEEFLAANRAKEGVVALSSGLQYLILKAGDGKVPTDNDTVECYYRGTLVDGTEFDGTEPEKPATFKVKGGVILGWSEALKLMPTGSKWRLFIPPHLAYGERGAGLHIGPNATLIYDLELLAVK